jgi:hypothetical protein
MTEKKKKTLKKIIFPVGIFLLIFLAETIIGITGVVTYFYFSGKKNIREIETYTVNYSKTMAEAFARVAEFSYISKKYTSLNSLFHEKIEENTIDEAFFVMDDGRLIVHSNTTTEKELMGNIAVDEMSYNLDMILRPVQAKSTELFLNNYNIVNKIIPFKRQERELLKKYVYRDIDSTGWLFTKGVFVKEKPVGSVNFIVSKERIYSYIHAAINQARRYSIIVIAASAILAFFISIVVFVRYRSIQKNALESMAEMQEIHKETPAVIAIPWQKPSPVSEDTISMSIDENDLEIDLIPDDDFDIVMVEEDGTSVTSKKISMEEKTGHVIPIKKLDSAPDEDEYITVEFLGEIESEPLPPEEKPVIPGKHIAPVISLEEYKNFTNREIRDAIPVSKKR